MGMLLAPQMLAWMKEYGIDFAALFDGASARLTYTPSVAGDRQKWTYSAWLKPGDLGVDDALLSSNDGGAASETGQVYIRFYTGNILRIQTGVTVWRETNALYRDPTAWLHLVVAVDTTQATAADRVKVYVNGVEVTSFGTSNDPALNLQTAINDTNLHEIGALNSSSWYNGYKAETHLIGGTQYTAGEFGETSVITGNWVAKTFSGSYGSQGATGHLDFSDANYLGFNKVATGVFSTNLCRNGTPGADIGNAVFLSECFDGDQYDSYAANSPYVSGSGLINFYAGKDWGSGVTKTITGFRLFPTTDYFGYCTAGGSTMTIKLQGSTDNFASSIVDLHTASGVTASTTNIYTVDTGITTSTAYRYHRIMMYEDTPEATSHSVCLSEVEFFESGGYAIDGHWNTLGATSQVTSTPTNVAVVWNALSKNADLSLSDGNRKATHTSTAVVGQGLGTFGARSGTYYWEYEVTVVGGYPGVGAGDLTKLPGVNTGVGTDTVYGSASAWTYEPSGNLSNNGSSAAYGASYTTGDTIGVELDMNAGTLTFYKNNVSQGTAATGLSGLFGPCAYFGHASDAVSLVVDKNDWTYTDRTGSSLTTNNLPVMTATDRNVKKHVNFVSWDGTGSASHAITGIGFQPGLVIPKRLTGASRDWGFFNAVRGGGKTVSFNTTGAEVVNSGSGYIGSLDADGFTVTPGGTDSDNFNASGTVNGATCFYLPTSQGNSDGSITVSAGNQLVNTDMNMSLSFFTGTAANATVGHGLTGTRFVVIMKNLTTGEAWMVGHPDLGFTKAYWLNDPVAATTNSVYWNDTAPTSTVVHLGSAAQGNGSGDTMMMWVIGESDFTRIGTLLPNAATDGSCITENLSVEHGLFKNDNATNWIYSIRALKDGNPMYQLMPDQAATQDTNVRMDGNATNIKFRQAGYTPNVASQCYYVVFGQPTGASNADEATGR